MADDILNKIATLSIKMRILKARIGADSETAKINDRQILILEMLLEKKSMSVQEICQCFAGVSKSTISMDIKLFRTKKWTRKQLSPEDERIHLLELTKEGIRTVREIQKQRLLTYKVLGRAFQGSENIMKACNTVIDKAIEELDKKLKCMEAGSG